MTEYDVQIGGITMQLDSYEDALELIKTVFLGITRYGDPMPGVLIREHKEEP